MLEGKVAGGESDAEVFVAAMDGVFPCQWLIEDAQWDELLLLRDTRKEEEEKKIEE